MSGAHQPAYSKKQPPAPGGTSGSKWPGMVPDRSTIPGQFSDRAPKATSSARPLSQYGTAEEFAHVFSKVPADQMKKEDFEQAGASFEEMRKAVPAEWPPERPLAMIDPLAPAETAETAAALPAPAAS